MAPIRVNCAAALLLVLLTASLTAWAANTPAFRTDNKCLKGSNHKPVPSEEGPDYAECHQYQTKSCCTANFTKKLAKATVTNIDNFYWDRCGALSKRCEEFMIVVECFYRCSPNVFHWEGAFPSSLNRVPVCHQFCDDWFAACGDDKSCATNWLMDFNSTSDGTNHCRSDSTCETFKERYENSTRMCEEMWGATFRYTTDAARCLLVNGTDLVARNEQAARRILESGASKTSTFVYFALLSSALVAVL